jgi:hypothetical protein
VKCNKERALAVSSKVAAYATVSVQRAACAVRPAVQLQRWYISPQPDPKVCSYKPETPANKSLKGRKEVSSVESPYLYMNMHYMCMYTFAWRVYEFMRSGA